MCSLTSEVFLESPGAVYTYAALFLSIQNCLWLTHYLILYRDGVTSVIIIIQNQFRYFKMYFEMQTEAKM